MKTAWKLRATAQGQHAHLRTVLIETGLQAIWSPGKHSSTDMWRLQIKFLSIFI